MTRSSAKTRRRGLSAALPLLLPLTVSLGLFVLPLGALMRASLAGGLAAYGRFFGDAYYLWALGVTFGTALLVTVTSIVLSYPLALTWWQAGARRRAVLVVLLLAPFYANVAVKVFGWMVLLPAWLEEGYWAIVIVDVHRAIPFAVLLLSAAMARIEPEVVEAARICGAGPLRVFRTVVLPLTVPGAVGAGILVFSLTSASFVVPLLVGGAVGSSFLPVLMFQQFTIAQNWTFAAAIAVVLLVTAALAVLGANRMLRRSAMARLAEEGAGG